MSQYVESIQRFSDNPNQTAVDNLVKHLGIAFRDSDGSTVAASQSSELDRIRDGFCATQLGLDKAKAQELIDEVCAMMKDDQAKCRVTFYYLLAEKAGQLDKFA